MASVKHTYDWRRDYYDPRDIRYTVPFEHMLLALPTLIDLRPQCPPVYDQGQLGSCHDGETDVLTRLGWRRFADLDGTEELATVDPENSRLTYERPTRLFSKWHSGVIFDGRHLGLDFAVTPDHKMLVRKWDEGNRVLSESYDFIDMKDVGWYVGLMNSVDYRGLDCRETYKIDGVSHKRKDQRCDIAVSMSPWLRFLGYFVAEGTLVRGVKKRRDRWAKIQKVSGSVVMLDVPKTNVTYRIQIAAPTEAKKEFARSFLDDLDIHAVEYPDRFVINNKRLYKALESLGYLGVKAPEKFVPNFVFDLPADKIQDFLDGHRCGDGHDQDGHISHYTSSRRLADDLQRLVLLSGGWGTITERDPRSSIMKDGRFIEGKHPEFRVSRWRERNLSIDRKANVTTRPYDGMVYCAEVPTYHTLVTRRNGKILISGNCVGNSLAGLYEFIDSKLDPNHPAWVPSRLFIYWDARAIEGTVNQDSGCTIRDGMKVLATKGVPPESAWPYDISRFKVEPPHEVWGLAWHHKIGLYVRLDNTSIDQIRSCLAAGFPFSFGFTVYESFESQAVAESGIVPMPKRGELILGGHAVLAVGYDDEAKHLIVRNSWGTDWGLDGYFLMPYAYATNVRLASDFWTARKAS